MGVTIGTLNLKVTVQRPHGAPDATQGLLKQLAQDDDAGVAETLASERRTLDNATQDRLSRFFGRSFEDVSIFVGPMAGALARGLSAEAVTFGQMMFFDPKHFRLDSPQGEALLAHELTHTFQEDSGMSVAQKEAEALATEAAYLSHLMPDGAPFAESREMPTSPVIDLQAAQAGDFAASGGGAALRAHVNREVQKGQGPRASTEVFERRVAQVLERVEQLLAREDAGLDQRMGDVDDIFTGPI
ncbi:MAG: DUF4157 domain-containing protein [Bradymonadia bacterium]